MIKKYMVFTLSLVIHIYNNNLYINILFYFNSLTFFIYFLEFIDDKFNINYLILLVQIIFVEEIYY